MGTCSTERPWVLAPRGVHEHRFGSVAKAKTGVHLDQRYLESRGGTFSTERPGTFWFGCEGNDSGSFEPARLDFYQPTPTFFGIE